MRTQLAAFFHDAVYNPQAPPNENEYQSSKLATTFLGELGVHPSVVSDTASIIDATAAHKSNDTPGCREFLDADLSILGSAPETYDSYAAAIRAEYSHVPDAEF